MTDYEVIKSISEDNFIKMNLCYPPKGISQFVWVNKIVEKFCDQKGLKPKEQYYMKRAALAAMICAKSIVPKEGVLKERESSNEVSMALIYDFLCIMNDPLLMEAVKEKSHIKCDNFLWGDFKALATRATESDWDFCRWSEPSKYAQKVIMALGDWLISYAGQAMGFACNDDKEAYKIFLFDDDWAGSVSTALKKTAFERAKNKLDEMAGPSADKEGKIDKGKLFALEQDIMAIANGEKKDVAPALSKIKFYDPKKKQLTYLGEIAVDYIKDKRKKEGFVALDERPKLIQKPTTDGPNVYGELAKEYGEFEVSKINKKVYDETTEQLVYLAKLTPQSKYKSKEEILNEVKETLSAVEKGKPVSYRHTPHMSDCRRLSLIKEDEEGNIYLSAKGRVLLDLLGIHGQSILEKQELEEAYAEARKEFSRNGEEMSDAKIRKIVRNRIINKVNRLDDMKLANERNTTSAFMNVLEKIAKSIGMKGEIEECEYIRDAVRVGIADPCGINMGNREKKPTLKYGLTPIGRIFLHSVQIRENAPSKRDFVEEVRKVLEENSFCCDINPGYRRGNHWSEIADIRATKGKFEILVNCECGNVPSRRYNEKANRIWHNSKIAVFVTPNKEIAETIDLAFNEHYADEIPNNHILVVIPIEELKKELTNNNEWFENLTKNELTDLEIYIDR